MIEKQAQNAAMGISANIITASDPVAIALMSIAISLKRIADRLDGGQIRKAAGFK